MKKRIISLALTVCLIGQMGVNAYAYRKDEALFTREKITVYQDGYGQQRAGKLAKYKGMVIKGETKNYYRVRAKRQGKEITVWVSKKTARENCLSYAQRNLEIVVDGTYLLGGQKIKVENLGDDQCRISLKETGEYITASGADEMAAVKLEKESGKEDQIFQFIRKKHKLLLKSVKNDQYIYENGMFLAMGDEKKAEDHPLVLERVGTNVTPYYNICQYDGRWGGKKYGSSTTMAEAGCGVLAIVNAVYALNGQTIDPMELAQYACDTGYRVPYNGTDEGFLRAAPKGLGKYYGFRYSGKVDTVSQIKKHLKQGDVIVAHVPGHYVAIVDYDAKKEKYLVLDSHPLPKRKTSSFGTWVKWNRLVEGGLSVSTGFVYEKIKDGDFYWDVQAQDCAVMEQINNDYNPNINKISWKKIVREKGKQNGKME